MTSVSDWVIEHVEYAMLKLRDGLKFRQTDGDDRSIVVKQTEQK